MKTVHRQKRNYPDLQYTLVHLHCCGYALREIAYSQFPIEQSVYEWCESIKMEREKDGTGWHWKNRQFIFYKFCLPHSFNQFIYLTFSYTEFYYCGIGIITCVLSQPEYTWIPAHTPPGTLQHCKTLVQIQMYSTNLFFARAESKLEHTWLKPYKWNSMNILSLKCENVRSNWAEEFK